MTDAPQKNPASGTPPPPLSTQPAGVVFWIGWSAAALFALTTAYFGANYFAARSEALFLRTDAELAQLETQDLQQRLEAAHILNSRYIARLQASGKFSALAIAHLDSAKSGAAISALVLWNSATNTGLLIAENLPPLPAEETYRLWIGGADIATPLVAGVFTSDDTGRARFEFQPPQTLPAAARFTVTRQRKDTAPNPESTAIVTGTL